MGGSPAMGFPPITGGPAGAPKRGWGGSRGRKLTVVDVGEDACVADKRRGDFGALRHLAGLGYTRGGPPAADWGRGALESGAPANSFS